MARPKKNNCDYFPHDAGMRNHRKVKAIITKFGISGYAVYSMFLEVLTSSDNFRLSITSDMEWELIAADLYTTSENLKLMLEYFTSLGLIQVDNNEFRSDSLIERFVSILNKRIRAKKSAQEKRELEQQIGRKIQSTNGVNRELRLLVFEKYQFKCNRCSVNDTKVLDVHHKVHRKDGGTDDLENLELLCANCHRKEHISEVSVAETNLLLSTNPQTKQNSIIKNNTKSDSGKSDLDFHASILEIIRSVKSEFLHAPVRPYKITPKRVKMISNRKKDFDKLWPGRDFHKACNFAFVYKAKDWVGTDMFKFFEPETLLSEKFASYLEKAEQDKGEPYRAEVKSKEEPVAYKIPQ
jgi:uncharacterized phage protein (TIGR02220 family)